MRPDLEKVIKEGGLDAAIEFLKNVGDCGIHLAKHETDALVKLIDDLKEK